MILPESIHEIAPLLLKYLRDELTVEEEIRLNKWASESERNRVFLENISEEKILKTASDYNEESVWEKIQRGISEPAVVPLMPSYQRPFYRRYEAAALIIIMLGAGTWLIWNNNSNKAIPAKQIAGDLKNDIAPGGNKAILKLANGSSIVLDNAQNGTLAQQGEAKVLKLDSGLLSYNEINPPNSAKKIEVLYNIISTPRGGQYEVVLADGSKVWLNAASSLRFPTSFTGDERIVELTGECYFEINPSFRNGKKMPFIVKINDAEVRVLGTHFNINAYSDEDNIRTTLLEGSVQITKGIKNIVIKPGEQARVDKENNISVVDNINTDEVVSWKNGYFQFNDADISSIMKMVSRWYDVDIQYEGKKTNAEFIGKIPRNVNVSSLFKILESTGSVQFKIEDKKIMVMGK